MPLDCSKIHGSCRSHNAEDRSPADMQCARITSTTIDVLICRPIGSKTKQIVLQILKGQLCLTICWQVALHLLLQNNQPVHRFLAGIKVFYYCTRCTAAVLRARTYSYKLYGRYEALVWGRRNSQRDPEDDTQTVCAYLSLSFIVSFHEFDSINIHINYVLQ